MEPVAAHALRFEPAGQRQARRLGRVHDKPGVLAWIATDGPEEGRRTPFGWRITPPEGGSGTGSRWKRDRVDRLVRAEVRRHAGRTLWSTGIPHVPSAGTTSTPSMAAMTR